VVSALIFPAAPKKGLITDLDGTLWSGAVGEVGADNVSWSLDDHCHRHALYQQLLASLADSGVMIGIASKNDPGPVSQALQRADLLLSRELLFPIEVHWGPKSDSVSRILAAWNVAPDAVVMVDDSLLELAEVTEAFPELGVVHFPGGDDSRTWGVMAELRRLFGKSRSTSEDGLRVASLRAAMEFRSSAGREAYSPDEFLAKANGCLEITVTTAHNDRALELINKTNQFNLNGIRLTDAAVERALRQPGAALMTVGYEDKFGPLGVIAAVLARQDGSTLHIDSWVMSCRAFARRIEYHCLRYLFDRFDVDRIEAAHRPTDRNGPMREFLTSNVAAQLDGSVSFIRADFDERAPKLVHRVVDCSLEPCASN
jgi:FkbH-like protein